MRSFRGIAAESDRHLSPYASLTQRQEKLNIIFGKVALYDAIMGDFYRFDQEKKRQFQP